MSPKPWFRHRAWQLRPVARQCDTRCIVWSVWLCSQTDAPAAALLRAMLGLGMFAAMPDCWPASGGAEQLQRCMPKCPAPSPGIPVRCHRGSHLEGDKRTGGRPYRLAEYRHQRERASSPLRVVRCLREPGISLPFSSSPLKAECGGLLCRGVLLHTVQSTQRPSADGVRPEFPQRNAGGVHHGIWREHAQPDPLGPQRWT